MKLKRKKPRRLSDRQQRSKIIIDGMPNAKALTTNCGMVSPGEGDKIIAENNFSDTSTQQSSEGNNFSATSTQQFSEGNNFSDTSDTLDTSDTSDTSDILDIDNDNFNTY